MKKGHKKRIKGSKEFEGEKKSLKKRGCCLNPEIEVSLFRVEAHCPAILKNP